MRALWWLLGTVAAAIPVADGIPKQVVQYGRFRTASTLQYQSLCAIMHLVHGADGAVAAHCLRHFSTPAATPGHVALDVRKIARSVAASLFVATPSYAAAADLLSDLKDCLPADAQPDLSWLDGVVAVADDGAVTLADAQDA